MSQWRFWALGVSSVLAIGGPGTYVGWQKFARSVDAGSAPEPAAPERAAIASELPKPIPIPESDASRAFNPVSPASYTAASTTNSDARGEDPASDAPADPSSRFRPATLSEASTALRSVSPDLHDSGARGVPPGDGATGSDELGAPPPRPIPFTAGLSDDRSSDDMAGGGRGREGNGGDEAGRYEAAGPGGRRNPSAMSLRDDEADPAQVAQLDGRNAPFQPLPGGDAAPLPAAAEPPPESAPPDDEPARPIASENASSEPPGLAPLSVAPPSTTTAAPAELAPAPQRPLPSAPRASLPAGLSRTIPPAAPDAGASPARANLQGGGRPFPSAELGAPRSLDPATPAGPAVDSPLVSHVPGERKLEGLQAPMLTVEKSAPEEIQVGKLAKYLIHIRNVGQVAAHGVVYSDRVPQGTQFVESIPSAAPAADGTIQWQVGTMQPGDDTTITMDLMPETEGEIGSVGQLTFHAQAAVRSIATRPLLKVEHSGPTKALIGDDVAFHITITNPGSGVATGVIVEVDVPDQLAHEGGREIMSDRFELRPNETRQLDLVLKAVQPGMVENVVRAVADANLKAEHRTQLEVVAPDLQVAVNGPARRYLQRQATYQIAISNPGTAPAQNIDLVAYLPQGLKFVSTEKKGRYDQQKHAVYWNLEELPAGESGTVQLSAIPIDTGEQKLHVEGRAALDLAANFDHTTLVEALTELVFTVADENDPIEVGAETTYEIRVTNNGSKLATNVRLAVQVPPELQALKADGPTKARANGDQIVMEAVPQLRAGEELVYRLTVQGRKAGDHVLRVQVASDEFSTPVTKEESTKVYADE